MNLGRKLPLFLTVSLLLTGTAIAADKDVIVSYRHAPGPAEENAVRELGGRVGRRLELIKGLTARVPEEALESLRQNPAVRFVDENREVRLPESEIPLVSPSVRAASVAPLSAEEYDLSWGVRHIGAEEFHQLKTKGTRSDGTRVKVAVLDTGVDYNHPDISPNYKGGDDFISLDESDTDPMDDSSNSHGTHVAGTIAAALNGQGVVGVAPEIDLYAVKVLDGAGFGSAESVILGLGWAVEKQMDIVNLSMELPVTQSVDDALQAAETAGILVVVAAGNGFGKTMPFPPSYDSAIVVTATTQSDTLAPFSSIGPQADLSAPGVEITSTLRDGKYGVLSGTSQAAPHVTGAAALLLAAGPPDLNGDGQTDFRDVRLQLEYLALDLGPNGRDSQFGFGRVWVGTNKLVLLSRQSAFAGKDARTWTATDGMYNLKIRNSGLSALTIQAVENGFVQHDQNHLVRLKARQGGTTTVTVDTGGRTLDLDMVPRGPSGASALVEIEQIQ